MRKIILILLAAALLAALVLTTSAQDATDLVLRLVDDTVPVPGANFEIYRIGQETEPGTYELTGSFSGYPVEINGSGEDTSAAANALLAFAKQDGLTPDMTVTTGADGTATAQALEAGVYLIAGHPCTFNGMVYHTEPMILVLPYLDAATGLPDSNPVLNMKFSREEEPTISRKVLKIWDDHSSPARPRAITVHLLKDGEIYDTVVLTAETQWRHVWEGLDASARWQIVEEVPEHYTVEVELEGRTFLLKNTLREPPPPSEPTKPTEPGNKIPQTGMLWWPALVLGGLGIALVAGGAALRKRSCK